LLIKAVIELQSDPNQNDSKYKASLWQQTQDSCLTQASSQLLKSHFQLPAV